MDLSFDIKNQEGDHLMVALSYYDAESLGVFTSDRNILSLMFYDITLIRKAGAGYVGSKMLFAVTDVLAKLLDENPNMVFCFYCDANNDVLRNHTELTPQEYRSRLFSRMFDIYLRSHHTGYINHRIEIEDPTDPKNMQIAHFICREEHENTVNNFERVLLSK